MSSPAKAVVAVPPIGELVELSKPRITMFAMVTAAGAMSLAPGEGDFLLWAVLLVGLGGLVAAANTLNMYLERESDCLMTRTRRRPLPSGRMAPPVALIWGILLAAFAVPLLTFAVNPLTGLLGVVALISYVLVYTPLKRRSTTSTLVGSLPGAMPALMGWTAVTGSIDLGGLAIFGILFLWQIPHFHAIAFYRREEYRRAGLKVLPVERGDELTRFAILFYLAAQVQISLLLLPLGVAGKWYTAVAAVLGAFYFLYAASGVRSGGAKWARNVFLISLLYLPLLFGAMVIDGLH